MTVGGAGRMWWRSASSLPAEAAGGQEPEYDGVARQGEQERGGREAALDRVLDRPAGMSRSRSAVQERLMLPRRRP